MTHRISQDACLIVHVGHRNYRRPGQGATKNDSTASAFPPRSIFMRRILPIFALLMFVAAAVQGQEPASILDKAMKATGGEAKLAKLQAVTLKGKGTYQSGGMKIPFMLSWWSQGADKYREIIEMEAQGGKSQETWVMNGTQGWFKRGPAVEAAAMKKEELEESREEVYFNWISMLAPLKGKDFKLTPLDEIKHDGRSLVGFTVSRKGYRDARLYFDKESGLLAKGERKVKEEGREIVEEVFFGGYKDIDGVKMAMRIVSKRDGKPNAEFDTTEMKLQEKLDDKLFTKP
jgi:hypothetical protein